MALFDVPVFLTIRAETAEDALDTAAEFIGEARMIGYPEIEDHDVGAPAQADD